MYSIMGKMAVKSTLFAKKSKNFFLANWHGAGSGQRAKTLREDWGIFPNPLAADVEDIDKLVICGDIKED